MNNFFGQCLQGFLENLYSLHIHAIRLQKQKIIKFFFHLNNQTSFCRWLYQKHEVNKWGFVFEGIRRWPVINLVTLIYRYLYMVSLEVVVGYRKLISFKGTLDQFKCITIETRYHVRIAELLIRSLQSQVA